MKTTIIFLKALCVVLILCIIATGAGAIYMTHVYATVTVSFGDAPIDNGINITATALSADMPLAPKPVKKPKH